MAEIIEFVQQHPAVASIAAGLVLLLVAAGIALASGNAEKAREYLERVLAKLGV